MVGIKHSTVIGFLVLASHVAPALAVNKCVGQDGRISYQEAECPGGAKEARRIATQANGTTDDALGTWKFRRSKDDMTKSVSCVALSPISFPVKPMPNGFFPVHAVVAVVDPAAPVFGLRTSENRILFHNDLSGMGVKASGGDFIPLAVKSGSHVVAPNESATLLAQLEKANELQARVRFWPHEQLYDIKPIPMAGFESALAQAKSCASSLR